MASLTTRLPLALGLLAAAATPAALATRSGLPDFDSEFMGQVLSYKRAQAKEVKEKVVEGVRSAGSVASKATDALVGPKEGGKP